MQHCTICECGSDLKNINLGPFPTDGSLPLVDHILGQLILDRYGPYAFARRIRSTGSTRDAVEAVVNFDLSPQPVPIPVGRRRSGSLSISDARHDCLASLTSYLKRLADLASGAFGLISNSSPTTLGRGSPGIILTAKTREMARKGQNTITARNDNAVSHNFLGLSFFRVLSRISRANVLSADSESSISSDALKCLDKMDYSQSYENFSNHYFCYPVLRPSFRSEIGRRPPL
ncbi:MAG: hypothetical protein ABL999_05460 [Pyrinomonadaceae bacterium]